MTSLHLREGLFLAFNLLAISDPYLLLCELAAVITLQFILDDLNNSFALTFCKLNGSQFNLHLSTKS